MSVTLWYIAEMLSVEEYSLCYEINREQLILKKVLSIFVNKDVFAVEM